MLAMSSEPSYAETIYNAIVAQLGGQYAVTPGSRMDAWAYATAMGLARARYQFLRVKNQADPRKASDLLPRREDEYGVVPGPTATLEERGEALAAKMRLPLGAVRSNVETQLRAAIGDEFIAYVTTAEADQVSTLRDDANFQPPTTPIKLIRLLDPVTSLGAPLAIRYENADESQVEIKVAAGDKLVIEPETDSVTEVVTVSAAITIDDVPHIVATFQSPHSADCIATTGPFPDWISTRRYQYVVVDETAIMDREKRRKVNETMADVVRGVSQWAIVPETAAGESGPFTVEDPVLGRAGLIPVEAAVTY